MQQNRLVPVCQLDQLVPFQGTAALVDEQQVALFRVPGRGVFALQNWDPIGKAFVLSRGIVGDVKGKLCVASPLYKQHFCLKSGSCLEDEGVNLTIWQTEIVDGMVNIRW